MLMNAMPTKARLNILRIDGNDNQRTDTRDSRHGVFTVRRLDDSVTEKYTIHKITKTIDQKNKNIPQQSSTVNY